MLNKDHEQVAYCTTGDNGRTVIQAIDEENGLTNSQTTMGTVLQYA